MAGSAAIRLATWATVPVTLLTWSDSSVPSSFSVSASSTTRTADDNAEASCWRYSLRGVVLMSPVLSSAGSIASSAVASPEDSRSMKAVIREMSPSRSVRVRLNGERMIT
ncbi:hypothetical protein [Cellulomonas denverensis]|uniref:hypothetical protein n=1 Tax=Cellulomonas denverensis TaxID=264297 RepID=UPI0035E62D81